MAVFQNPILKELFQVQYAPVLACLFLLIFICTNSLLDKKLNRLFLISIVLVVVLLVVDGIEYYCESLDYPTVTRIITSILGYTFRPLVLLCIIFMILRGKRKKTALYFIPCGIVFLSSATALFTDIAFSYDINNEFVRGPLGLLPHAVSLFYMVLLVWSATTKYKDRNNLETMYVVAIIVTNVFSVAVEMTLKYEGILNISIMLSITFYYLLISAQAFKRDVLTGVFNRRSFYIDVEQKKNTLTAVISMDLNDLKMINDTKGHAAGDRAICTVTKLVKDCLRKGCYLYRTGGDEFVVLVFQKYGKEVVEEMLLAMEKAVGKAGFGCAFGMAYAKGYEDYSVLLSMADQAMYENKIKSKGSVR